MKIFICLSGKIICYPYDREKLILYGNGCDFFLEKSKIKLKDHSLLECLGYFKINNVWYRLNSDDEHEYYLDVDGNVLNLKSQILDSVSTHDSVELPGIIYGSGGNWRSNKITSCNIKENSFIEKPIDFLVKQTYIFGLLVCVSNREKKLFCLNQDLNMLWSHDLEMVYGESAGNSTVNTPVAYGVGFILNLGADKMEYGSFSDVGHEYGKAKEVQLDIYLSSNLRYYHVETGELIWQQSIEGEIQQYRIVGDIIYLCTHHLLMKISADTGEILHSIDTGLTTLFHRHHFGNSLYVVGDLLFYGHSCDKKFLLFSSDDLSLIRDVPMPKPWRISAFNQPYYHEHTNKLYFQVSKHDKDCWVSNSIMEIDPANITEGVIVEPAPEFTCELIDSTNNHAEKELLITNQSEIFVDMLRFAEVLLRDKTFEHGLSIMGSHEYTKEFNGNVHFHYLGSNSEQADVKDMLDMLEQRFNHWATTYSIFAADQSTVCRLSTNK